MKNAGDACAVPAADWSALEGSYDEVAKRLSDDAVWVRFFGVRPCCPAPGYEKARELVGELKSKVSGLDGITGDERRALQDMADARLEWYASRFCR